VSNLAKAVERYYAAFNRKDWGGMLAELSPDIVHEPNQGEPEKGAAAFERFLQMMAHHYDEQLTEMTLMTNARGDRVSAEFLCSGIYLQSAAGLPPAKGQTYRLRVSAFFEGDASGKITRVTNYYNMPLWLQQVR
jgi:steroid delta-isomerase-like uncharacterized protein